MTTSAIYRSNESIFASKLKKEIDKSRIIRTAKRISLSNSQKDFGKKILS
jgi:putative IMPACT (imprinted ancient) family translation regulator